MITLLEGVLPETRYSLQLKAVGHNNVTSESVLLQYMTASEKGIASFRLTLQAFRRYEHDERTGSAYIIYMNEC